MEIVYVVVGIAIGAFIGILFARNRKNELVTKVEVLQSQLDSAQKQQDEIKSDAERQLTQAKSEFNQQLQNAKAEAEARQKDALEAKDNDCQKLISSIEEHQKQAMQAQKAQFDETLAKMVAQTKTATEEMLKQRQKEFTESSSLGLGQIVDPLKETITKMKDAMDATSKEQNTLTATMQQRIEDLIQHSDAAKNSADELARVFKHSSKVQGDWGEVVLDELLASQGLTKGVHYHIQETLRDNYGNVVQSEEGKKMRPDVILHLDKTREVVIDSKVSLTAFMEYVNAENETDRQNALKAHIDSLLKHVKELSTKDYSSYIQAPKVKMEYVIMFVPHSVALWTALNAQPDLWRKAMDMNVYIADEQTLFAALKIINLTWAQIKQAENHEKVYELAKEMLNRVGQFEKNYLKIVKALEEARGAYSEGTKKLTEAGQSIPNTCRKLIALGAKQNDKNKITMLDVDDVPALDESKEDENV